MKLQRKWEYKKVDIKYLNISELEEALNIYGNMGWNIIYFSEKSPEKWGENFKSTILLKRKI